MGGGCGLAWEPKEAEQASIPCRSLAGLGLKGTLPDSIIGLTTLQVLCAPRLKTALPEDPRQALHSCMSHALLRRAQSGQSRSALLRAPAGDACAWAASGQSTCLYPISSRVHGMLQEHAARRILSEIYACTHR